MNSDTLTLAAQILSSRSISSSEHQMLSDVLVQAEIDEGDRVVIQRIFYGIRHGMLQITD
ncbi:MAG: hypothetical protein HC838_14655 [Spirulinaceae cyanobacterium RM2_2_10]|nr:hypothetical protein [Spirulinaceae cyanobacterium SM2_1_0]NJO21021.1 hypothetical protein [Spirulinaceae cyanobacterium RM2_2_10]